MIRKFLLAVTIAASGSFLAGLAVPIAKEVVLQGVLKDSLPAVVRDAWEYRPTEKTFKIVIESK
jgi:hypothetical protein